MKFNFVFKTSVPRANLVEYTQDRFLKLKNYVENSSKVHVTFSAQQYTCAIEVVLHGNRGVLQAAAEGADFHQAIDKVVNKILKQLAGTRTKRTDRVPAADTGKEMQVEEIPLRKAS